MCEVYRGAEINIALAAAADGSESALSNRDTSLVRAVSTRALWHDEGATEPDWIVFSLSTGVEDLTESQLMKRAWVVQELQLATRTVVLGADQIYHICRPVMSCETFPGGMPGHMHQFLWFRKLAVVYRYNAWDDLVQTFSKCGITKASDWTMAIAGLARWYAKQLDDEYVAGLWRSLLPCCLLWAVQDDAVTKRAAPYRAPTWSWLSIEGPVCCTSQAEGEQDLCDIISIRVDLIDSRNPYGQIRAGDIILRGYVTPVTLWGKREFAMIGTTDCNTGKIVALTPKRPRIGSRHGSCYLSRDVQTSEHGSDFDDLQLKPDGSIDSLLTIQVGPDVDKVDQLEECSITRYVRAYALPVSQCSLSERGFLCVDGLLLVETQGRSGSFSRIGWFNICAYSDAVDRLTATERCSVRIV
ncbi:uncharacterized protein RHO25_000368 [Cercospora beticola]|uniref:Heterokaryon incompatibility domain-containing protein n=1 Tax=Cercospora beticola TaxID=122368 RepID=A0ABZ0N8B3_CERBT|nr:hypothetical protein RHO25_000368 [Cercospora beticola]CAK1355983.1 unnamed protein product [Cercospora beticola]